jgi:O-antigen/teichoic acid export membrane protein
VSINKKLQRKLGRVFHSWREEWSLQARFASIGHLLTGNFLGSVIGLVSFALTARALGPANYGILALCFGFTRAIERLVSFQTWQPLIKYGVEALQREDISDFKALLKFGFLLDISAALAGWLLAITLVLLAGPLVGVGESSRYLVLIYCTVLLFQISGTPTAILRLYGRFVSIAYGQVGASLCRVAFCAAGAMIGGGLFEFAVIWITAQIVGGLIVVLFALRELRRNGITAVFKAPLSGVTKRFPGLWRFALSANISLTIRASANEVDTLLVGYLAGPAAAGLYHIAKRVGRIAQQAGVQVQAVLYPELARAWANQAIDEFKTAVVQMQGLLFGFGVVVLIVFFFFIGIVLRLTAGEEFAGAAPLATVQAVAVMMTLGGTVMRSALLAMGLENSVMRSVLISTLAFYATALLVIPYLGAMGANVAHIVMATLWLSGMTIAYRRKMACVRLANDQI